MVDEKKPTAPAASESEAAPVNAIDALIDRWHFDSFHGTRAGNDVEIWNLIHAAKEDLKLRLAAYQEK